MQIHAILARLNSVICVRFKWSFIQASQFDWRTSSGRKRAISQGNVVGNWALKWNWFCPILYRGFGWPRAWELELLWFSILFVWRDAAQVPRFPLNLCHGGWVLGASPEADREMPLELPWSWWWWMQTCCLLSLGCQWGSPSWWTFSSWKWSCHRPRLLYFHWRCVPSCVRTWSDSVSQSQHVSFSFAKQCRWL